MEGKAVLFKRFADVDSIDLEVDTEDAQRFIDAVALLGPSFGGINLEDIAAPDCFIIEQALKERMNIPVFHDDQHGTAIITAAGLINACHLTGREFKDIKVVVNGAGAAAIACTELIKAMGVPHGNVIMCDRKGVIHKGRSDLDQFKSAHAVDTEARTLKEALVGADVFLGLSAAGALKPDMVDGDGAEADHLRHGQSRPGDPAARTPRRRGPTRSSPPAAPTIPTRSTTSSASPSSSAARSTSARPAINEEMKIAAAQALAELAREAVPEEVAAAYGGNSQSFGPDYIIPAPFDPRLIEIVPCAVAEAAMRERRRAKADRRHGRLSPDAAGAAQPDRRRCSASPMRPPGPIPSACCSPKARSPMSCAPRSPSRKAAMARRCWSAARMSMTCCASSGSTIRKSYEVLNSRNSPLVGRAVDFIYAKHQRHGMLRREVERMVNQDRNTFAAAMLALGEGDAMITGTTRPFSQSLSQVRWVIDDEEGADPVRHPRRRRPRTGPC